MGTVTATATPQDQIDDLIKQVAEESGLEVSEQLASVPTTSIGEMSESRITIRIWRCQEPWITEGLAILVKSDPLAVLVILGGKDREQTKISVGIWAQKWSWLKRMVLKLELSSDILTCLDSRESLNLTFKPTWAQTILILISKHLFQPPQNRQPFKNQIRSQNDWPRYGIEELKSEVFRKGNCNNQPDRVIYTDFPLSRYLNYL